jgi:hypothetical protein
VLADPAFDPIRDSAEFVRLKQESLSAAGHDPPPANQE